MAPSGGNSGDIHVDFLRLNYVTANTYFGQARLVKKLDGKLELVGGTREDRTAAREWISLFFHEAVVTEAPHR